MSFSSAARVIATAGQESVFSRDLTAVAIYGVYSDIFIQVKMKNSNGWDYAAS